MYGTLVPVVVVDTLTEYLVGGEVPSTHAVPAAVVIHYLTGRWEEPKWRNYLIERPKCILSVLWIWPPNSRQIEQSGPTSCMHICTSELQSYSVIEILSIKNRWHFVTIYYFFLKGVHPPYSHKQVPFEVAPTSRVVMGTGQSTQSIWPFSSWYLPTGQSRQLPFLISRNEPSSHGTGNREQPWSVHFTQMTTMVNVEP